MKSVAQQHYSHNTITAELSDRARARNLSASGLASPIPTDVLHPLTLDIIREAD
jgi:hypothetical protein